MYKKMLTFPILYCEHEKFLSMLSIKISFVWRKLIYSKRFTYCNTKLDFLFEVRDKSSGIKQMMHSVEFRRMVQNLHSTGSSQVETRGGSVEEGILSFFQECHAMPKFFPSAASQMCHGLLALLIQLRHGDFLVDKLTCWHHTKKIIYRGDWDTLGQGAHWVTVVFVCCSD